MTDVGTLHPSITTARSSEWELMRDCVNGESAIKARGEIHLAKPSGFKAQPDGGNEFYGAYKGRAQFPEILAPSISAMVGIIHGSESKISIELPGPMEFIIEKATQNGLTLEAFHRRITRQLLEVGRYGILTDVPQVSGDIFLAGYTAESIINWEDDGSFFVLDETTWVRMGFEWTQVEQHRVLELDGGRYRQLVFMNRGLAPAEEIFPTARGDGTLTEIPFVVATARDLTPVPETPPLVGVARAARAIYQLSADYRLQLYMSGQETLFIINGKAPKVIGSSVVVSLEGDESRKPDAKYVGPSGIGIKSHKEAMEDNRKAAVRAGARMFDEETSSAESGVARRLRFAAETATLMSVAQNSCAALEVALRHGATIMGLNPEDVRVIPPTDLLDSTMTASDASALTKVWMDGAISYETLYGNLQRGGIADSDRTAEDETKLIEDETDTPEEAGLIPLPDDDQFLFPGAESP